MAWPSRSIAAATSRPITVARPWWLNAALWLILPVLGAGLGWIARAIASWVASLPAAPFQGPFKLVAALPQPWATVATMALGVVAGLVLAFLIHLDNLTVTVHQDRVRLARGDVEREFDRGGVVAVFVDNKELVLLRADGSEWAREKHDLRTDRLANAFRRHGFTWRESDPYDAEFTRWVEETPGLPAAANALLKARAKAIKKGDHDDAKQLREELAKLNVVVRERDKRQFWRRTTGTPLS